MNLAPPSWLRADWLVWMCLWLRLWMLHTVFDLCAKRAVNRRFAEGDLNLIGPFLAEAEAELAWAIARRVRRLAGRPVYCPRVLPACPKRQGAFIRRYRQIHVDCLFIDRRVAKRLRRLQRARAAVPRPVIATRATSIAPASATIIAFAPRPAQPAAFAARAPPLPIGLKEAA